MSYVVKRNGNQELVAFDKITSRINKLCYGLSKSVDPVMIAQKVIAGLHSGITTTEIDELAAQTAAYLTTTHPDFSTLAARIAVDNLHRDTTKQFSQVIKSLYEYRESIDDSPAPLISKTVHDVVMANRDALDSAIIYGRDHKYSYFGFKTLERSYLLRMNGRVAERPQHMIMRVAVGIHQDDIAAAIETYHLMSERYFTHATPTLYNAGTCNPQLSSCFLLTTESDSINGIFNTIHQCAMISKTAGGIGLNVHHVRATGSYIRGTNGQSNGLVPMLRVFDSTARYVDQGGNKRPGAFAIYLEPWHADIFGFLDLKKNTGKEENRARHLFYGLWIPDLFMLRVRDDADWSLFCPSEAPGLADVYGTAFETLYTRYETEGRARKTVKAQRLWRAIMETQIETGTPYMLYKDAANAKSNQKNLGTIRCSNLCTEIIQFSGPGEVACCNLASVSLPAFVNKEQRTFDYEKLQEVVRVMTRNLNKVVDINQYPVEEARLSNMKHRPLGLGVQGLADAFIMLRLPFESEGAAKVNRNIFECIYYASLDASCQLAERLGHYESYPGSPASQGILQLDMWPEQARFLDWTSLRERIKTHGLRNSLLVAPMPTASTSQILGNNEAFEPYTSNLYSRRVLSGDFQVVNPHLFVDLNKLGLWDDAMRNRLIANDGSIQSIRSIPQDIKDLYKTVWEISQRKIIDMAADRAPYIDQSQSLNIHIANPDYQKLTSMHFYGWSRGLKTGMYYLRSRAAADAIKFTVNASAAEKAEQDDADAALAAGGGLDTPGADLACSRVNPDCMMCSG